MLNQTNKFIGLGRFMDVHLMRSNTSKVTHSHVEKLETMGRRIRRLREARLMTQEELGAEVGVTKVAVSQWEASREAKIVNIKLDTFLRLCAAFNVEYEFMIYGRERKPR